MELLKLVIVDDEPILLQGLLDTYDWESMGFEVVGSAKSGVQALEVIRREQPHVVLTDIRMKQMTGLMVMEEIQKEQISCLFVVLSAYRDFEYAKHACDLGAYAYLLKPIDDEQLRSTMTGAYNTCIKQLRSEEKYESWEQLLLKDGDSFLQVVIQKYVQNLRLLRFQVFLSCSLPEYLFQCKVLLQSEPGTASCSYHCKLFHILLLWPVSS